MRAYHFINSEYGLHSLRDKRLKISEIDKLNDPFEFLAVNLQNEIFRNAMNKTKSQLANKYGILCFSQNWHSPLQWAHYADKHQGICLGFEISEKIKPRKVTYIEKRDEHNLHNITEEEMQKLLSTKHKHWSYEQEIRIFVELIQKEKDKYFYNFTEDMILKEVIIGYKSKMTEKQIIQSFKSNEIAIFKVKPSFEDFKMVKA